MNINLLKKQLGLSVKNARVIRGMTQLELAQKTLVSIATIKRIEAGGNQKMNDYIRIINILNEKMAIRLCDATKFNPADFTDDPMKSVEIAIQIETQKRVRHENR